MTRNLVDIGIGRAGDPMGSEAWALAVRLQITGLVKDIPEKPERLSRYMQLFIEHRGWALVHDKYGDKFRSFDAFCECPQPYGLGQPWREVRAKLTALLGEKAAKLATHSEEKPHVAGPGRGHAKETPLVGDPFRRTGHTTEEALRAINRAPEPARDLFKRDLLGVKEAAKLGPKRPTPDEAARVTSIANELEAVAESVKDEPKPKAKRVVTAKARELLGVRRDRVTEALRLVEAMNEDERDALKEALSKRWPTIWENAS